MHLFAFDYWGCDNCPLSNLGKIWITENNYARELCQEQSRKFYSNMIQIQDNKWKIIPYKLAKYKVVQSTSKDILKFILQYLTISKIHNPK